MHPNVGLNWNVNTGHVTVGVARFVRNRLVFGQYSQKNAHVNASRAPEVCEDRTPKAAGRNTALQWRDFGLIDPARLGCDGEGRLQRQPQVFDFVCCADMRIPAVTPDKVRPDVEWKLVQRRLVNAKRSPPAQK